ncbi:MAG: hypothetical protein WAO55_09700 [Candidatus Manganitrophaceae bacterium]
MDVPWVAFTPEEQHLIRDTEFFRAKAIITQKARRLLEQIHAMLREELASVSLLAPEEADTTVGQFVKGEHLNDFPYQYLDLPKYYSKTEKFAFRSLFWWGHHFIFALILEGPFLDRYKENLLKAYDQLVDQGLCILIAPTLWEWEKRPELLLEIRKENRKAVEAALATLPFLKIQRFVAFDEPAFEKGEIAAVGRSIFKRMKTIIVRSDRPIGVSR